MRRTNGWLLTLGCLCMATLPCRAQLPAHPGDGLRAEYFNGPNFENKVLTRTDPQVAFDWNWRYPAPGVQREYFSVRWTGKLLAPVSGRYRFSAIVDDGVRVWVGGKKVIDEWRKQDDSQFVGEVTLKARHWYDFRVEYFNDWKGSVISVNWEVPTEAPRRLGTRDSWPTPIPGEHLYSPARFAALNRRARVPTSPPAAAVNAPKARPVLRKREGSTSEPTLSKTGNPPEENATSALAPTKPFRELSVGQTLTLKKVLFAQSSYDLLPQSFAELDELAGALKLNPALRLEIAGHTDNLGDPRLNQALSEHRAKVVVHYLTRRGIDERRMEARGYGGTRPLVQGTTESDRSKNRRVEITVK